VPKFLRLGNIIIAVDKIVAIDFQDEDEDGQPHLSIYLAGPRDLELIAWRGPDAMAAWAYWCGKTELNQDRESRP
jgi:hypothetical protein